MRIALLLGEGFPNPVTGGGALTAWTIMKHALDSGHEVAVCVAHAEPYYDAVGATVASRTADLVALGAEVRAFPSDAGAVVAGRSVSLGARARRLVRLADIDVYPQLVNAPQMRDIVRDVAPHAVLAYHFEAVSAGMLVERPRFAAVGDPSHLPGYYRWRDGGPSLAALRQLPSLQARLRNEPRVMTRMLAAWDASGAFAAHHAAWLRQHGVPGCRYLRTPVPDTTGPQWSECVAERKARRVPRILLLGHLRGVVTIDGMRLFARDVLPQLERELGPDGFEVRIVGGYELSPDLTAAFARPSVQFAGHTEEADEELRAADCLVVPTSIPLGIRVRIITAFSIGCPVVAHHANTLGIPELVHEQNGLVGKSGAALAREVLRIVQDPQLALRLGTEGRSTWERGFSPRSAGAEVMNELERLARRRR